MAGFFSPTQHLQGKQNEVFSVDFSPLQHSTTPKVPRAWAFSSGRQAQSLSPILPSFSNERRECHFETSGPWELREAFVKLDFP